MSGGNWKRYPGDRSYTKDHPLMAPEEIPWCEWCGHSHEFCTCSDDLKCEEERKTS